MDAVELGNKILRDAGLFTEEAIRAKRDLDARLDGLGLGPSVAPPVKVMPGRVERPTLNERVEQVLLSSAAQGGGSPGGATTALLLDRRVDPPDVIPAQDIPLDVGQATMEPSDLSAAVAVTSLATTAAGGTEVKFNKPGIIYVGAGSVGVYWNRALGASINTKWAPVMSGMRLAYQPQSAVFFGQLTVGNILPGGALTLLFFEMPPDYHHKRGSWKAWHKQISEWTEGAGDNSGTAGVISYLLTTGGLSGYDVTLGTFSDAGAGTQIFKAATNMPVGGATSKGRVIVNAPGSNSDAVWVGETAALAVASNGAIMAAGQDEWSIPVGGKLFMLANSGTQKLGARYRS